MEKKKSDKKYLIVSGLLYAVNLLVLYLLVFVILEFKESSHAIDFIANNVNQVIFFVASLAILTALTYAYFYFECKENLKNYKKTLESFMLLDLSVIFYFLFSLIFNDINARPFGYLAVMTATLLGRREAIFLNVIFCLVTFVIDISILSVVTWDACACMLITFCSGLLIIFFSHKIKSRIQSVLLVFLLLIPIELIVGVMEILLVSQTVESLILFGYGALGALFSVLLYMITLPVFEIVFSELTVFRLRELTGDDAKLIKKLKTEAPGTYNHSVVVAQLVEACASAIGENAELARAAAYYHDMGKLKNPEMFTENQADYNMHNELSPELSADIIRSHTRDGARLIKKNRLPEFFADVAVQHHGTLPIKYFYAKALKMSDGEVSVSNYSYAGPKPQSKIAAIIMIADAAEAATRSLSDRSSASVEKLVRSLIEERLDLEQFDDCDITMRELSIITRTIASSLSGVYHSRITYPKIKISKNKEA